MSSKDKHCAGKEKRERKKGAKARRRKGKKFVGGGGKTRENLQNQREVGKTNVRPVDLESFSGRDHKSRLKNHTRKH